MTWIGFPLIAVVEDDTASKNRKEPVHQLDFLFTPFSEGAREPAPCFAQRGRGKRSFHLDTAR